MIIGYVEKCHFMAHGIVRCTVSNKCAATPLTPVYLQAFAVVIACHELWFAGWLARKISQVNSRHNLTRREMFDGKSCHMEVSHAGSTDHRHHYKGIIATKDSVRSSGTLWTPLSGPMTAV
jgi:hypothetical protein